MKNLSYIAAVIPKLY